MSQSPPAEQRPPAQTQPVLEMRRVSKTFPGVKALDNVQLQAWGGEVLALPFVSDVALHRDDAGEPLGDLGQPLLVAPAHNDRAPALVESGRETEPDPAAAPGDENGPVREIHDASRDGCGPARGVRSARCRKHSAR